MWKSLRLLHGLASRAGIEKHFGFRELRHTAATLSFAEGARGKEVQEMLGHSSIRQTMDTYTDLIPTIQEQAAKRLDSALFG
jgi:integrase